MLQYFEKGIALYAMAVVFALGVVSKLAASHTYKRLIRQCDNFASTRDGYLKQVRSRYESLYRLNDGMKNCGVFVEKQVNQYRILRIPIQKWENMAMHAALLCFLAGVGCSFLCFWYSFGVRPIVLHFVAGVMFGVALVIIDGMMDTGTKKEMLTVYIQDYLENNFSNQLIRGNQTEGRRTAAAAAKNGMQDDIFMKKKEGRETIFRKKDSADRLAGAGWKDESAENEESESGWSLREKRRKETTPKASDSAWDAREEPASRKERTRDADTLRKGLEQIAAARESREAPQGEREKRKLTPEEEQLLEDIIKEYLN